MLRLLLMILALIVLLAVVLVWLGVINIPAGGNRVEVQPVNVSLETRNVAVPVPVVQRPSEAAPANQAQPAPAQ
jgi:hypothetical protein